MEDTNQTFLPDENSERENLELNARAASEYLKAIAHEGRLVLLCHLIDGEKAVGELEFLLGARQAAVSQQLARLRHEGLVRGRREGKTIFYSIGDPKVLLLIETLRALFCEPVEAVPA